MSAETKPKSKTTKKSKASTKSKSATPAASRSKGAVATEPIRAVVAEAAPARETAVPAQSAPQNKKKGLVLLILAALFVLVGVEVFTVHKNVADRQWTFKRLATFGSRGGSPEDLQTYQGATVNRVDSLDRLLHVDVSLKRILVMDTLTKKWIMTLDKTTAQKELFSPYDVGADTAGTIYVLDATNSEIVVFSAKGEFLKRWPTLKGCSLAVEKAGTVLVVSRENNDIIRYSPEGEVVDRFAGRGAKDGKLLEPHYMALDEKGDAYILDLGKQKVEVFSPAGKFLKSMKLKFKPEPLSFIFVQNQNVFVTDFTGNHIWVYATSGKLKWEIGYQYPVTISMNSKGEYFMPTAEGFGQFSLEKP